MEKHLNSILEHNRSFVENKEYESYLTGRFPEKKLVIITCMDTRLVELLPKAMNFKNGDVKIIKNAGRDHFPAFRERDAERHGCAVRASRGRSHRCGPL
ncbi:Carbonic anhydrase [Actinobacillus pleuropneumoniae]|nr:Carbonic anhydrase [Actinobacillus pleuropneumoniae]